MSVARVNPLLPDTGAQGNARVPAEPAADFAAVARSVAAGDLQAAQKALAASGAADAASARTLAQTLAEGNLAAARLALAQLGANAFEQPDNSASGPDAGLGPSVLPPGVGVPGAPVGKMILPDVKVIAAVLPPPQQNATGPVVADVGATLSAPLAAPSTPGATVTSANGGTYAVADVMLALALGNAGSIPPDVINLYGPGGAKYDPAAIMDAYRNSDLGKAQIAAISWIGRPA